MTADVLTSAALNRATLARQLLLERSSLAPVDAITHLVGLQSQNPLDPHLSLWSRLDRFDPDSVGRLLEDRALVRFVAMRGTIHLVTASDACRLRPLTQPVLDAEIARHSEFAEHLVSVLVDGGVAAVWLSDVDRSAGKATLVVEHLRLTARSRPRVEAEGRRAARFWHPTAVTHGVHLVPLP